MLATYTLDGPAGVPPVLIVHGLFGSARNWGVISKKLSASRPVISVDMRNHGDSAHLPSHSYADMAADLAEVIRAQTGPVDVIGHSMGGKAAMMLALTAPELVNRLVVADIAPVAYSHTQLPLVRAMQGLDLDQITSRKDADLALQPEIPEPGVRAFLIQSLDLRAEPKRWKLNLTALAGQMPQILGFPEVSGNFDHPTLFLSGGASDYVREEAHPKIKSLFSKTDFEVLPGVNHWLHAEAPGPFLDSVTRFLDG